MQELRPRLTAALVAIWKARKPKKGEAITGFGLLLSKTPRVTSVRFILARSPKDSPAHLDRQYGIGPEMYALMCAGRSPLLGAMESESGWGAHHLEPLRQPIAALQTIRRRELGVAALQDARDAGAFGRRPLFLWTKYPQDRDTTKRLALQLNDPDALTDWRFF